ncbi:heavy-metal-associated domain-containing protein [Methylophilaceae bacterium]|nr:heavy-metal-associated domain-containing protein [Methylophilaceae bacterium]|tara:strand:- start:29335 stop:29649 length:315 start_codon:yes stop_codon:yes gene_type:complete
MKKLIFIMLLVSLNSYAVTQKIVVLGMVCAFCAQGLDKSFKAQKNVKDVFVNLENNFVAIESKDENGIDDKLIKTIIIDSGYDIQKIEVISDSVSKLRRKYELK